MTCGTPAPPGALLRSAASVAPLPEFRMRLSPTMLAVALAVTITAAQAAAPTQGTAAQTTISQKSIDAATQLRERALNDDTGYKVVESLTTEVGPRMAGSEADP